MKPYYRFCYSENSFSTPILVRACTFFRQFSSILSDVEATPLILFPKQPFHMYKVRVIFSRLDYFPHGHIHDGCTACSKTQLGSIHTNPTELSSYLGQCIQKPQEQVFETQSVPHPANLLVSFFLSCPSTLTPKGFFFWQWNAEVHAYQWPPEDESDISLQMRENLFSFPTFHEKNKVIPKIQHFYMESGYVLRFIFQFSLQKYFQKHITI